MRTLLLVSLLLGVDGGLAPATLTGVVQSRAVSMPCRGGARVLPEEIKSDVRPLPHQPLTFVAGRNPYGKVGARATSDERGHFEVQLAPGQWCVLFGEPPPPPPKEKAKPKEPRPPRTNSIQANVDADCLEQLQHPQPQCDAVVQVTASAEPQERVLEHVTSNQCPQPWAQPCYRGPAPP
ncbi:MAG: hypothetical protein U0228_35570 [Myxococcaceae bacterium]